VLPRGSGSSDIESESDIPVLSSESEEEIDGIALGQDFDILQTGVMTRDQRKKFEKERIRKDRQSYRQGILRGSIPTLPEPMESTLRTRRSAYQRVIPPAPVDPVESIQTETTGIETFSEQQTQSQPNGSHTGIEMVSEEPFQSTIRTRASRRNHSFETPHQEPAQTQLEPIQSTLRTRRSVYHRTSEPSNEPQPTGIQHFSDEQTQRIPQRHFSFAGPEPVNTPMEVEHVNTPMTRRRAKLVEHENSQSAPGLESEPELNRIVTRGVSKSLKTETSNVKLKSEAETDVNKKRKNSKSNEELNGFKRRRVVEPHSMEIDEHLQNSEELSQIEPASDAKPQKRLLIRVPFNKPQRRF